MRTSKPFSTISYNSIPFLQEKLGELVNKRKINFYAFVEHFPEEEELKKHKHLLIMPNGLFDTNQLDELLVEPDPEKPDKPFKCMPFESSKFDDWFLYASHNTEYLASKGQKRKFHYARNEFVTSDDDYFIEQIHTIDVSKINRVKIIREAVRDKVSFDKLIYNGQIPIQQINQYDKAYAIIYHLHNSDKVSAKDIKKAKNVLKQLRIPYPESDLVPFE